jgi:hypothetical protein
MLPAACRDGLRLASLFFGARFRRGFRTGDAVTQARFVGPHFAQLALTLLNGGLQAGKGFLTLVARLLQLRLLGLLIVEQRLLLALLLFQLGFCVETSSRVCFSCAMVS